MGYRQDYEKYYKIKLDNNWDVHHIDYNHNNNDVNNLVALPNHLHQKLHEAYRQFELSKQNFSLSDIVLHSGQLCAHTEFMQALNNYINIVNECTVFMNMRNSYKMRLENE